MAQKNGCLGGGGEHHGGTEGLYSYKKALGLSLYLFSQTRKTRKRMMNLAQQKSFSFYLLFRGRSFSWPCSLEFVCGGLIAEIKLRS